LVVKGTLVIENGQFVSFTPDVTPPGFMPPGGTPPGGTPPGGTPPPNAEFEPPTFEFGPPPVINDPPIFCVTSCRSTTAVIPGAELETVPDGYVAGDHLYVEDEESVSFIVNGSPGASGEFSVVFIALPDPVVGTLYDGDGEGAVPVDLVTLYDPATTFTFQADGLEVELGEEPLDTSFSFVAVDSSGQTSDVATVNVTVMENPCEYGCGD